MSVTTLSYTLMGVYIAAFFALILDTGKRWYRLTCRTFFINDTTVDTTVVVRANSQHEARIKAVRKVNAKIVDSGIPLEHIAFTGIKRLVGKDK